MRALETQRIQSSMNFDKNLLLNSGLRITRLCEPTFNGSKNTKKIIDYKNLYPKSFISAFSFDNIGLITNFFFEESVNRYLLSTV